MSIDQDNDEQVRMQLRKLREPFKEGDICKLPKGTKAQNDCLAEQKQNCRLCGGWHHPKIIHLDYVGHAALTNRLLEVDPFWAWEPLAVGTDGLPVLDKDGGLWIRLTVCGVTRLGYGDAQGKTGPNAAKERIGDALRNAGMRFGLALDLWHKGELHQQDEKQGKQEPVKVAGKPASPPPPAQAQAQSTEPARAEPPAEVKAELSKLAEAEQFAADAAKKKADEAAKMAGPPTQAQVDSINNLTKQNEPDNPKQIRSLADFATYGEALAEFRRLSKIVRPVPASQPQGEPVAA